MSADVKKGIEAAASLLTAATKIGHGDVVGGSLDAITALLAVIPDDDPLRDHLTAAAKARAEAIGESILDARFGPK